MKLLIFWMMIFVLCSCNLDNNDKENDDVLKYEITYNNGEYGEKVEKIIETNLLPEILPLLEEDGYRFDGWYLDDKFTIKAIEGTILNSNVTLYAKWTKLEITEQLEYMLSEDGSYYLVSGLTESVDDVVIPAKYNNLPVEEIAEGAFMAIKDDMPGYSIVSVTIPSSVKRISAYAFSGCNNLKSIYLGNGIKEIDKYAFCNLPNLESINVSPKNSVFDSRNNCNAVIKTATNTLVVGCKETNIPETITTIDKYAFYGSSKLSFIKIPDSVTTILSYAFHSCTALQTIIVSKNISSIGEFAFANCTSLTTIYNASSLEFVPGGLNYGNISRYAKNVYNKNDWSYVDGVPTPKN